MEKLNRVQKCSILGPQNLGSRGGWAPGPPRSTPAQPTRANEHNCSDFASPSVLQTKHDIQGKGTKQPHLRIGIAVTATSMKAMILMLRTVM